MINPQHVIPCHYDDYDVFKSPLADFKAAGLDDRVTYLNRGETYTFPLEPTPEPVAAAPEPAV